MAIETTTADNFFVVRWGDPDPEDFARIFTEVTDLRAKTGKDVLYLGIMPEDMPKVDPQSSKRLMQLVQDVLPLCSMVCVAMEMRGFRNAIIRSAMTTVTLITRRYDKLKFVESTEAALESCREHHLVDRGAMARAIEQAGGLVPAGFVR